MAGPVGGECDGFLLVLRQDLNEREDTPECGFELLEIELVNMEGIRSGGSARFGVIFSVRSGDEEHSIRSEDTGSFFEQELPVIEMLDKFERGNEIEGAAPDREGSRRADHVASLWEADSCV